jgi:hypothetical protein
MFLLETPDLLTIQQPHASDSDRRSVNTLSNIYSWSTFWEKRRAGEDQVKKSKHRVGFRAMADVS